MPAKYSHVKKRTTSGLHRKNGSLVKDHPGRPSPHTDRALTKTKAPPAVTQLERGIARLLLLRYEQDIARLFSTRLYNITLIHLPTFAMRCISLAGPSWLVHNADSEEIKDFLRAAIAMDMRQAGERVATKSVLWSYTALRHFAMSNNIPICAKRGLHSLHLLDHAPALLSHVESLESLPAPAFSKPPHLGSLQDGIEALEDACELKFSPSDRAGGSWDTHVAADWQRKVGMGYERLVQTLWRVAREFDVRGYGSVLREKLLEKWCDCGCSTDHLGEVCERSVRAEEEEAGGRGGKGARKGAGKQREWDGRGSGVFGWETEEEEDVWEVELDFGGAGVSPDSDYDGEEGEEETVGQVIEWRFYAAEREKEKGNFAFRQGDFPKAVYYYKAAHKIEPELPHYQLNLAAAHLKLNNWMEAETACTKALSQHRSTKGFYRRARARRMLGRPEEAIRDLRAVLKLQPTNTEALSELEALLPPIPPPVSVPISVPVSSAAATTSNTPTTSKMKNNKTKHPPPLPWPRTAADDRKLKVIMCPASYAEMAFEEFGKRCVREAREAGWECGYDGHGHNCRAGHGRKMGAGSDEGKERRTKRLREMEEIIKTETIVYPSWERYVVKKVD